MEELARNLQVGTGVIGGIVWRVTLLLGDRADRCEHLLWLQTMFLIKIQLLESEWSPLIIAQGSVHETWCQYLRTTAKRAKCV